MKTEALIQNILHENPYISALVVDRQGKILFMNSAYLQVLGKSSQGVIGKHITEITPESRTMQVLENGKEQLGYSWKVNGHTGVACSVPIFDNGELIGCFAYSIFMDNWKKELKDNVFKNLVKNGNKKGNLHRARYNFDDLIGRNKCFVGVVCLAAQIARHDNATVLITGESGTGKEIFAQSIHNNSRRGKYPFVRVNCASIPHNLLESELFGYEEGAYTGARKSGKEGKFELANGGTIFLDEIGEMPLPMQSKILIFLQEREVDRLGGKGPIKVDVRVIAATNKNLERMVEQGDFREDLYFRLNVLRIEIPPLRQRKEDIPELSAFIIDKLSRQFDIKIKGISPEAEGMLLQYNWPGNVRELENVLERAIILADLDKSCVLQKKHLSFLEPPVPVRQTTDIRSLKAMVGEFEKQVINQVLEETDNDKVEAARYLGINLSSLYRKARKYGIE